MSCTRWEYRIVTLILATRFLLAGPATAQNDLSTTHESRTLSPYFVVEGGDSLSGHLPLLGTDVRFDVAGVIVDVKVRQSYRNDGTQPIHAKYVFPASTRAAVHGLVMTIGDHRITAKIKEREVAKAEFKAAKKAGKNAALLEQQRPNVFSMNVSNVMPGQEIDVELRYTELLVPENGIYEFVYPTVVGPRYSSVPESSAAESDTWVGSPYTPEGRKPTSELRITGGVAAGIPIENLVSPSHAIVADRVDATRVHVSLDPEELHAGDRDFVLRYCLGGGRIRSGILLYEGKDENFFLMMLQSPLRVRSEQIPPREYIFVVDVSGSMYGFPLDTAKSLLRDLIGSLRPTDTFNVLFFSGGSQLWAARSRAATRENIENAIFMLDSQRGGGGTELLAAMRRALALPHEDGTSRSLIVITDGYISAEREVFEHIRAHLAEANVFAFGIGSSVNRYLIQGIARAGQGEAFVVLDPAQVSVSAQRFRDYVGYPILTDVHVTFDGFDVYDVEPPALPDLLAERPIIVHGKWRGMRRGSVVVHGRSGQGPFRRSFELADVEPSDTNQVLRLLWARERIARISDYAFFGETEQERSQLVELGLVYNLLTKHTSFIAVHELIVNLGGDGDLVAQPLPLPAGVSNLAVGGVKVGDEPRFVWLLVLLVGFAILILRQGRVFHLR